MLTAERWAEAEFAGAEFGDPRRRRRLIDVAAGVARAPAGRVSQVFRESKKREGAYRSLESKRIQSDEIKRAALQSCLERTAKHQYFFVPVDGSSLTLTDRGGKFGFGRVGTEKFLSRGVEVMTAIGLDPKGTPLGFCGQEYWTRGKELTKKHRKSRPIEKKETRHWLTVINRVEQERSKVRGAARPWFQLDRGGDFKELIDWASSTDALVTVRASANRVVRTPKEEKLWTAMGKARRLGRFDLEVKKRGSRRQRTARIEVRARKVSIRITLRKSEKQKGLPRVRFVNMWAVFAREVGRVPKGDHRIEWLLLTNQPVRDFETARLVIKGYSYRWRIEEFHRTWKTSCGVENAQLRSVEALQRWAAILAVVALRIQRMVQLARTQPKAPASTELSQLEIDALLLHKQKEKYGTGFMPTIKQAQLWIAEMGGYTGKSSGGPPGAQTTERGLNRLMMAADTLSVAREVIKKI
jgi:hypothetical protein